MSLRKQNALFAINKTKKGLEIGPLHDPLAPKREGYNVEIIDHLNQSELKKKYDGHGLDLNAIEEVDYVWQGQSYAELTGKKKYYDYVIASHVIEHTPDLIGFLLNLDNILKDDGVISLVILDKRYCFDFFRPLTGISKIIDAYENKNTLQTNGSIIEYYLNVVKKGDAIAWSPETNNENTNFQFVHDFKDVEKYVEQRKHSYVDVHSWVFTPHSFRLLIHDLFTLGYIPFQELCFFETNGCEFYFTLTKNIGKSNRIDRLQYLKKINIEMEINLVHSTFSETNISNYINENDPYLYNPKSNENIIYYIDEVSKQKNSSYIIKGWVVNKKQKKVEIRLSDFNAKYTIEWHKRKDVEEVIVDKKFTYPYFEGFIINIQSTNYDKIKILFINGENVNQVNIELNKSVLIKVIINISKKYSIVKQTFNWIFENSLNIPHVIKKYGFKIAFLKAKNKFKTKYFRIKSCSYSINNDMEAWFIKNYPSKQVLEKQKKYIFNNNTLISIVVPVFKPPILLLIDMLESVIAQTYSNWELCIVDAGKSDETKKLLDSYTKKDNRIKVKYLVENKGIAGNTNEAIAISIGAYVGFLDHDDTLMPNCLFECVSALNNNKNVDFIYTDEYSTHSDTGQMINIHLKPDFSIDTLRSCNYICHFLVVKKQILTKIGGIREGFDGSQDHDLVLRLSEVSKKIVHIPKVLYNWKYVITSSSKVNLDKAIKSATNALNEHLVRLNIIGIVTLPYNGISWYKINYQIITQDKISIIIPNKDHIQDLSKCINSILTKSTYKNYEIIIVENNSTQIETFEYYKQLEKNNLIRIVKWEGIGFNFSALCNYGVKNSKGDFILLLNNDTEVITPSWMEEMLMLAQRDDVGVVGVKLLYPNETIQHCGVIIGLGGVCAQVIPNDKFLYRREFVSNYSAVTGACMMIKKSLYNEVKGLDEELFKVAYNDIDLCLKIRALNKLVVYTPFAKLFHYESKSRGIDNLTNKRFVKEIKMFKQKWHINNFQDPYYNPNLTLNMNDFRLDI